MSLHCNVSSLRIFSPSFEPEQFSRKSAGGASILFLTDVKTHMDFCVFIHMPHQNLKTGEEIMTDKKNREEIRNYVYIFIYSYK